MDKVKITLKFVVAVAKILSVNIQQLEELASCTYSLDSAQELREVSRDLDQILTELRKILREPGKFQ